MCWTGAPQTGHGLLEAAVHRHLGRNAVTFSGNPSFTSARRLIDPQAQRRPRRVVQTKQLLVRQRARQLQRREPGRVQDLVGVGVADAAEEVRIGERPFQRVFSRVSAS
jgi:hypothetical protein